MVLSSDTSFVASRHQEVGRGEPRERGDQGVWCCVVAWRSGRRGGPRHRRNKYDSEGKKFKFVTTEPETTFEIHFFTHTQSMKGSRVWPPDPSLVLSYYTVTLRRCRTRSGRPLWVDRRRSCYVGRCVCWVITLDYLFLSERQYCVTFTIVI